MQKRGLIYFCILTSYFFIQSMLKLNRKDYDSLRQHGEETYPHECCGVLLGRFEDDGTRVVTSTARCGNTRTDSAHNRYNIDPKELVRIQREGRDRGEDIVGFYHSHPDHPPSGRRPITRKPTGSAAPTSSPAWKRARPSSQIRSNSQARTRATSAW